MSKNTLATPFTNAILEMKQEDSENTLFGNNDFKEVKELVQRIVEEIENLKEGPEKEKKKKALLRKVAKLPDNRKGTIFTALRYTSKNDIERKKNTLIAKKRYERFLNENASDESQKEAIWKVYNNLGIIEQELGNSETARDYWKKVPEEAGDIYYKALFSHGKLLFDEGYAEMALNHWDKIPEESYLFGYVCSVLGDKALEDGFNEEAKTHFKKIRPEDEGNNRMFHYALYQLGYIAFNQEDYEQAIDYMRKAQDFGDRNYILGISYFSIGNFDEALPFLELVEAKENNDDFVYAHYALAYIYFQRYNNGEDDQSNNVVEMGKSFLEYYDKEIGIGLYFAVNHMIGAVLLTNGGREYLEKVTPEAGIELYGKAQRALGYIDGYEDGEENS